jgi:hypothetical protein
VIVAVTPDIVDLARRASAGETAAADELLRELEPLVVRTVRLVVGSGPWTAEDAAQDALLDIDRGIHSLRDPRAVRAWALRVATQRAPLGPSVVCGAKKKPRFRGLSDMGGTGLEPVTPQLVETAPSFASAHEGFRVFASLQGLLALGCGP